MTEWAPKFQFNRRFWMGCAMLVLSVSFAIVSLLQFGDARDLAQNGITTQATVTNANSGPNPDDPRFEITYEYDLNGALTETQTVPETFFRSHPTGTTWTIRVHPDDPTLKDIYPGETRNTGWGFVAVSAFMALIGALFVLSGDNRAALRARFAPR